MGKLVTSLTMTAFYVLLYYVWVRYYGEKENQHVTGLVYGLAALRAVLCLFPQNGWLTNSSGMLWGVIRNIPFAVLGAVIIILFYRNRGKAAVFRYIWLLVLLSFLFYIPVAAGAGAIPMLGMLMLPKTVCYIIMILTFYKATMKENL